MFFMFDPVYLKNANNSMQEPFYLKILLTDQYNNINLY